MLFEILFKIASALCVKKPQNPMISWKQLVMIELNDKQN